MESIRQKNAAFLELLPQCHGCISCQQRSLLVSVSKRSWDAKMIHLSLWKKITQAETGVAIRVVLFVTTRSVWNHLHLLFPDTDARPQDLQATFWEQTSQVGDASRAGGRSGMKRCWVEELNLGKRWQRSLQAAANLVIITAFEPHQKPLQWKQNCLLQIHNDHGLIVESRRLKDVDGEHWDLSGVSGLG